VTVEIIEILLQQSLGNKNMTLLFWTYVLVSFGRASAFSEAGYTYKELWGEAFRWPVYLARWVWVWIQKNKNGY